MGMKDMWKGKELCRPGTTGRFFFIFIHTKNNVPKRLYNIRSRSAGLLSAFDISVECVSVLLHVSFNCSSSR